MTGEIMEGEVMSEERLPVVVGLLPALNVENATERRKNFHAAVLSVLVEGRDYGAPFPGSDKQSLLLPGAQALQGLYGLEVSEPVLVSSVEDWEKGLFFYRYQVEVFMRSGGELRRIGFGIGSANSWESKWRYRWVQGDQLPEDMDGATVASLPTRSGVKNEFAFAVEKAETTGQYGKPQAYWDEFKKAIANGTARKTTRAARSGSTYDAWEIGSTLYRIDNPEIYDQVNTIDKMAQKRAYMAGIMMATGASELFTQDGDDAQDNRTASQYVPPEGIGTEAPVNGHKWGELYTKAKEAFGLTSDQCKEIWGEGYTDRTDDLLYNELVMWEAGKNAGSA